MIETKIQRNKMQDNKNIFLSAEKQVTSFTDNCENDIRRLLNNARNQTYRVINSIMTQTYWLIGCRIVMQEQKGERRAEYGSRLIETLSQNLSSEFGGVISVAQLKNFRQFYLTFPDSPKGYTVCSELSWSHIYNYILKCFVLIDLKTTQLTHQDIGQMDMYVRMFDSLKKQSDDNPTIGLILCAEKDEVVAKYSILSESKQIFASKYVTVLPSEAELEAELDRNRRFLTLNSYEL